MKKANLNMENLLTCIFELLIGILLLINLLFGILPIVLMLMRYNHPTF